MTSEAYDLGVAILAEGSLKQEAEHLRSAVAETVTISADYSLDNMPHITLFQGRFPSDALAALKSTIKEVLSNCSAPLLQFENEFYLSVASGNVFWNLVRSKELMELHQAIVQALNPLRQGLVLDRYSERLQDGDTSERHKQLISEYGVVFVGENYLPHITLAQLDDKADFSSLNALPIPSDVRSEARTVVLGRIGEAGDLLEILDSFPV